MTDMIETEDYLGAVKAAVKRSTPRQRPPQGEFFDLLARGGVPKRLVAAAARGVAAGKFAIVDNAILWQRFKTGTTAKNIGADLCKLLKSGQDDVDSQLGYGSSALTIRETNLSKGGQLADGEYFIPRFLSFEVPYDIAAADLRYIRHTLVKLRARGGNETIVAGKFDMFAAMHRYTYEQYPNPPAVTGTPWAAPANPLEVASLGHQHRVVGPNNSIYGRLVIRGTTMANQVDYIELENTETWTPSVDTEIECRLYGQYLQTTANR